MQGQPGQSLAHLTDEQLVTAYRAGRGEAFDLLVHRYHTELFHFLVRFVSSRATAEDIFQEAFLQVHQSIGTFDPGRRFKPWLFTIAANKARDHLRKTNRRPAGGGVDIAAVDDEDQASGRAIIDLLKADLPLPSQALEEAETRQRVRRVIEALPTHLREVLLLAYFNQFSYKEISSMLQIPLGTVKSRLHAAVGTFAELWQRQEGSERG
jgi:RNA polymerase sigma-70 factor (ECF subfamily)